MYFTSELVHKLWSKAHWILWKFWEVMNAAGCALCMVLRFSRTISDDDFIDSAGRSSERVAGNLILEPVTSSNGEKPATFWKFFFAFNAQVRTRSGEVFLSAMICPSCEQWFGCSSQQTHCSMGFEQLWCVWLYQDGLPFQEIHCWYTHGHCLWWTSRKCCWQLPIYEIYVWWWFPCFYLEWLTWRMFCLWSILWSKVTISLKWLVMAKDTTGRESGFLYILQTWHFFSDIFYFILQLFVIWQLTWCIL